jgi:hypothetical protein
VSNIEIITPNVEGLDAVLPPKYSANLVWHYTDASGALGIVTDNAIRASSIWSMNDSGESRHGVELIQQRWEARRGNLAHQDEVEQLLRDAASRMRVSDAFIACASMDGESLSQWRAYGTYSFGINTSMPLQVRTSPERPTPPIAQWTQQRGAAQRGVATGWRQVLYDEGEKYELIDRLLASLGDLAPKYTGDGTQESGDAYRLAMEQYATVIAFLKHPSFKDEREVRLHVSFFSEAPGIQFRVGRFGVVPYVQLEPQQKLVPNADDFPQGAESHFPLREIVVGPGLADPIAAVEGLTVALQFHKFDVTVRRVDVPYR